MLKLPIISLFIFAFSASTQAMCIYNHSNLPSRCFNTVSQSWGTCKPTPTTMHVHFTCSALWGMTCHNYWTIQPGEKKCRYDKDGHVHVWAHNLSSCGVHVDKHGWVVVTLWGGAGSGVSIGNISASYSQAAQGLTCKAYN